MSKVIKLAYETALSMVGGECLVNTGQVKDLLIDYGYKLIDCPLHDRLSDGEKDMIRRRYADCKEKSSTSDYYSGYIAALEFIFGKECLEANK